MSGSGCDARAQKGNSFREAIANWRLALHTEVKRSSSLPTAMFDACDPMLEARLAESAELMLAQLHEPDARLSAEDNGPGDQRLEVIGDDELVALPDRIAGSAAGEDELDLGTGLASEYLGILADVCCTAHDDLQERAVQRLCLDFGVSADCDLERLAHSLAQQAQEVLDGGDQVDADLAATCRQVAAVVTLHGLSRHGRPESGT